MVDYKDIRSRFLHYNYWDLETAVCMLDPEEIDEFTKQMLLDSVSRDARSAPEPERRDTEIRKLDDMGVEIIYTPYSSELDEENEEQDRTDTDEEEQDAERKRPYIKGYDFFTWMLGRVQRSATFSFFQCAVKTGALEFTFDGHDRGGHPVTIVHAVGFLIWAERHGYGIPADVKSLLEGRTVNRRRKSEVRENEMPGVPITDSNEDSSWNFLTSFANAFADGLYRRFEPFISELLSQRSMLTDPKPTSTPEHHPEKLSSPEIARDGEEWISNKEATTRFLKGVRYQGEVKSASSLISKACRGRAHFSLRSRRMGKKTEISADSLNSFIKFWNDRDMDREDEETRRQRGD